MKLVQSRIVTDDVERLAGFYARLLGVRVALNEYYVEIEAGPASVGFSRRRFTEYRGPGREPGQRLLPPRRGHRLVRPKAPASPGQGAGSRACSCWRRGG